MAATALLAACAPKQSETVRPIPLIMESRARLMIALQSCSEKHGFDPAQSEGAAETALAPGEREWRACAYTALRVHALSNSEMKGQYERLIEEDMKMTAAIEAGTLTRSERRSRIDALVAEIRRAEDARVQSASDRRQFQILQLRGTIDGLQEFTR